MPVSLTTETKVPLNDPPAASQGSAVDQLLIKGVPPAPPQQQAYQPPQPIQEGHPVVAHVEQGQLDKSGNISFVTSEQIATGMTLPPGYNGPVGKVTYGCAATVNTGNYENIRPFVQIEVPFVPGQQDAVYDWAFEWADARITGIVTGVKKSVSGA